MNDYASTDADDALLPTGTASSTADQRASEVLLGRLQPGWPAPALRRTRRRRASSLRHANDTLNPKTATPIAGCTKQFVGPGGAADERRAQQWTDAAKTTRTPLQPPEGAALPPVGPPVHLHPRPPGDYYLQVRTNVSPGGTAVPNRNPSGGTRPSLIYTGNSNADDAATGNTAAGTGLNSFALRAVPSDPSKKPVHRDGRQREHADPAEQARQHRQFNLIRALPAPEASTSPSTSTTPPTARGRGGTVQIVAPADATGSVKADREHPELQARQEQRHLRRPRQLHRVDPNSTHDGQLEHIVIPIPNDYNCNPATLGGCWFSVQITFTGSVTDFTTWTANIGGDPVRLVE